VSDVISGDVLRILGQLCLTLVAKPLNHFLTHVFCRI